MHPDRRRSDSDRRQNRRVPAIFAVKNAAQIGAGVSLGQAEDIGPGGMSLRWPKETAFTPSAPVTLTFMLPGCERPIAASALIVSEKRLGRFSRTGVSFTGLGPEQSALINAYCAAVTERRRAPRG
jgi:hypothetical protein